MNTVADWLNDPLVHDLVTCGLVVFVALMIGAGIYGVVRPGRNSGERERRTDRNGPGSSNGPDSAAS